MSLSVKGSLDLSLGNSHLVWGKTGADTETWEAYLERLKTTVPVVVGKFATMSG